MEKAISYNHPLFETVKCSKIFKEHTTDINSIDFSNDGQTLISASDDGMVNCYDILEGKKTSTYFNKKYDGISNITFTHSKKCVICSSNSDCDNRIMYWSLYDNTILLSFLGHTDQITGLEMNNNDDTFLSSSKDGSVRIWNLSSKKLLQHFSKVKFGCFDPQGKNIAILSTAESQSKNNRINIYPTMNSNAIATFNVDGTEIKTIKYSPNGKHMVCASDNSLLILETLNGKIVQKMEAIPNESGNTLDPSFTPVENTLHAEVTLVKSLYGR